MAIKPYLSKVLLAFFVSAALIWFLLSVSEFNWKSFHELRPQYLALVWVFHVLALIFRGLLMKALSDATDQNSASAAAWIHLASRHQFVFTILPTGLGDLFFPTIARRLVGGSITSAARTIAQVRARDFIALGAIAIMGAVASSGLEILAFLIVALAFPALLFADAMYRTILNLIRRVIPDGRLSGLLENISQSGSFHFKLKIQLAIMSVLIWVCATCSVLAAFAAIGNPVSLAVGLLFLAGINISGALAISIGGLGVSEIGGTAALLIARQSLRSASTLALLARPLLLASMLLASGSLDVFLSVLKKRQRLAYRQS